MGGSILMFGGYDESKSKHHDNIYEYKINGNKWNKMSIKMPKPMYVDQCTLAIRNKFVLFFGSYNHDDGNKGDIFIYSVSKRTFIKSTVKCPKDSVYHAITINDEKRDEKTVFGYIRKQWKLSQIPQHHFPPYYILTLMSSFYYNEFVHI